MRSAFRITPVHKTDPSSSRVGRRSAADMLAELSIRNTYRPPRNSEPSHEGRNNATAAAAQPSAPALQINTVTAAAASAATANNMPSSAVPIDDVAVEIAAQSQNGKNSFEIRLDPQELGRIDVRLDVYRDGNVTTRLIVDRAETLDLLKRDASNIERTLQDAGLKTSDNTLQFSLRDQQSFTGNDRNNGTGATTARIVLPDDDGVPLEAVRSNYGRLLGLGRGVDISI